ncbi:SH3 domain-containing protein [Gallaecimonas sp. GXIMD1310]|uniref:SH3 domain-containing protein n=1 Tax=Gallaecimonas sp. GXIMD1310 TaxID=3131926 RepID=UPI0032467194
MAKVMLWLLSVLALPAWAALPWVTPAQLQAHYWQQRLAQPERLLMNAREIARFNKAAMAEPSMVALADLPKQLPGQTVRRQIQALSHPAARFNQQHQPINFAPLRANLALPAIGRTVTLRYALVVKRTSMRTFPTDQRAFNRHMDQDIDRFQETGLFTGEPLAVLHISADGRWAFAQAYHYRAWVAVADIAFGPRRTVLQFAHAKPFLVVTGRRTETVYNPELAAVSRRQLAMGVRLPLLTKPPEQLYGQNTYAGFVVRLPVRQANGRLALHSALIPRGEDVHQGYLPLTGRYLIGQAFKLLGQRYGWGHDYDGRDCTGFISDLYRSFGLVMPRNASQQGRGSYGRNWRFSATTSVQRKQALLAAAKPGTMLYMPGHAMLLLGHIKGQSWVIHDVESISYRHRGQLRHARLNGVSVTPLAPLRLSSGRPFIEALTSLKALQ